MRKILALIFLLLAVSAFGKENCGYEAIGIEKNSSEINKYFYTGTCHYRNKNYLLAVKNWEKITQLSPQAADDEELKIDVLNNLGYMKFFGIGTETDKDKAMSYWLEAIQLGHYEAEYHLCHAYADSSQPTYDVAKARKHCEKAKLIYKGKDDSDPEILKSIQSYLDKVGG